ncbi:efflux RND transporter periplasmic adaptor subunit [Methylocapsa acidiphila]|uniref:efflux RND transporter periplasmic adaptor subunit n=1 Tax=Methylocapsa acidiphila TaxID=133552 RepID=UPI00047A5CC9|nr:efflux RND transporter periplasmic adaptor subunit [Methylocapsa acidiphila]
MNATEFVPRRLAAARLLMSLLVFVCCGHRPQAGESAKTSEASAGEAWSAPGLPVIVAAAAPACFSASVRATGLLAPRAEAVAGAALDGFEIAEIFVAEGDFVREGQALARLSRLPGEGITPARNAGALPPASVTLQSPAAGSVIKSAARRGAAASLRGEPLFRLAIDGVIEVDAEVSSIDLAAIKPGQSARIEAEPGQGLTGRVRKVGAEVDPVTQMGHVRVEIPADSGLRAGRFVRATIDARQSCGISVPRAAVLYKTEGTSVQVVREDRIETIPVRIGLTSDRDAEIAEGLQAGELVVANGGASLRDGDRVFAVVSRGGDLSAGRR